jgi:hypothetical protein
MGKPGNDLRELRFFMKPFKLLNPNTAEPVDHRLMHAGAVDKHSLKPLTIHQRTSGRCEQYCAHPCNVFADGTQTIIECNGCSIDKPCRPGSMDYGSKYRGNSFESGLESDFSRFEL